MTDVPTAPGQRPATSVVTPTASDEAPVVRRPQRPPEPERGFERLVVPPDTGGPRIRLGLLWFCLALASVTSGRWWTAGLMALVAAAAAYQTARSWAFATLERDPDDERPAPPGTGRLGALAAALCAASVPLAAGYGTGAAGAALVVVAAVLGVGALVGRRSGGAALAIAALLPAIASSSIVLALQIELWAALFLVLAVSLYDAGNFLLGADASGRWEGPVGGIFGAMAVTFTIATIGVPPLDHAQWWIAGVVIAATCSVGQWVTSALLPAPDSWVPAMRRLDAYVVAGPVYLGVLWMLGA